MALVLCSDLEEVKVQAFGKWFSFKPGQVKSMDEAFTSFLNSNKRDLGFVALPTVCEEEPDSKEAKDAKEQAFAEGRKNIVSHLTKLRYNFEVSTQKDIDVAGEKRPYMTELSPGHKEMYRRLALFAKSDQDALKAQEHEVAKLKEIIDGPSASANAVKANPRS